MTELKDIRPGERIVFNDQPGRVWIVIEQQHGYAWVIEDSPDAWPEIVEHLRFSRQAVLAHGEVVYTNDANCSACGGRLALIEPYCGWPASIHITLNKGGVYGENN